MLFSYSIKTKMSFKTKVLASLGSAIDVTFDASSEGSTGNGKHEKMISDYFTSEGFPVLDKVIKKETVGARGKKLVQNIFLMDSKTHSPNKNIISIPGEDGYYQIPQPYSVERGSFNPAPDMYLVSVINGKIIEWIGIECKSSSSLKPTWNDNLPRPFKDGNIVYLFTGKKDKETYTCIFTHEVFFDGKDTAKINSVYENTILFLENEWKRQNCDEEFAYLSAKLRRKCEQQRPISITDMLEFNRKTILFLSGLIDLTGEQ